jgi:predicted flap endonuclease-1-like 5' DNA nuclease
MVSGMAYVVVLLIAVAVAFPAGWLVCRAWLSAKGVAAPADGISSDKHHSLLQAQRSRYRGQVQRIIELVRRHETARDQLRSKLAEAGDRLDSSRQQNEQLQTQLAAARDEADQYRSAGNVDSERVKSTENAMSLLQIERDELSARVHRLEEGSQAHAETGKTVAADAEQRAERGELREKLAAAEHRRHELETKLADRDSRIEELEQSVASWKHRVIPLTRQVQSYREAVRKLQQDDPAEPPSDDLPTDSLQQIKGIGPALERRLNAQGIQRFAQIAALATVELADLADKLAISPTLPERDKWIEQASKLAESADAQVATA